MSVQLQRPLVVGGIGLTLGLWGLDSVFHSLSSLGELLPLGAIAVGGGYWLYNSRQRKTASVKPPTIEIDRATLDRALSQVELVIDRLKIESPDSSKIDKLRQNLTEAQSHLTRADRQIAITGGQRVGKSSLLKLLATDPVPCATPLKYIETPALFSVGAESGQAQSTAEKIAFNADLVVFITNGDLTATEYKYIATLDRLHQRVILLFNQADRYLPDERNSILQKLKSTVAGTLDPRDVTIASTAPAPIKVRKIQADGTAVTASEIPPVEIASFTQQLAQVLATESEKLIWATTYRQIDAVQTAAKAALNTVRRDLALPSIEQNQWIVAAAALANPVPALDLIATAAVNAQMVMDLGTIYQQKFSLDRAQTAAGAMGEVMLKLGIVEVCTQTVAGLLKTNAATYVAGGLVQGLSAAYLTRIAGLTLVEYFETQDLLAPEAAKAWNLDLLGTTLQKVFQANQRVAYLQTIFQQGIERLAPESLKLPTTQAVKTAAS
jgi:uncharacterized protein